MSANQMWNCKNWSMLLTLHIKCWNEILMCVSDLEDDVWREVSDSADGTVLYLHGGHLQRVLQQRPHYFQLRVARGPNVWEEHMEVRTLSTFKLQSPHTFFLVQLICLYLISSSSSVLAENQYLSMNPVVSGVFTSPYPFGIDPVRPSHLNL